MAYNHFDYVPSSITDDRSVFDFKKAVAHGAQLGYLYPVCAPIRTLPGDTLSLNIACEIRSGALIAPLMDEMYCDFFAFFVPNRIVWEHWKQFLGATDDVLFSNLQSYTIPHFKYGCSTTFSGTTSGQFNYVWNQLLACHFELPFPGTDASVNDSYFEINALPFRGYTFIHNEFFIPEQIITPQLFGKTDAGYAGDNMTFQAGSVTIGGVSGIEFPLPYNNGTDTTITGGVCLPVYKVHRSLWTSCLPQPNLVTVNLLNGLTAPVGVSTGTISSTGTNFPVTPNIASYSSSNSNSFIGVKVSSSGGPTVSGISGQNIVADLSQAILTVNAYRECILLDNYYQVLDRAGSRYDEILANLFHTRSPQAVIDIPELIVHKRFTIYRKEVVALANSTDSGGNIQPIGSQSGYINTIIRDDFFTKSVTEHGYFHLLFAIRPAFTRMAQGIEPAWTQLSKLEQFYPQFQGMGDVPRYKYEVFADFSTGNTSSVIGYQEYSAEYKYQKNTVTGWFDPNTPNPLRGYAIVTNDNNPGLNWYFLSCIEEEDALAKCLTISSPLLSPQFILDIRLSGKFARPMKVYNIPGAGDLL